MKLVREDTAHADELTAAIIDILKRKANTCGPDQAAARRNLVALGEIKEEKSPVKVSNEKPAGAVQSYEHDADFTGWNFNLESGSRIFIPFTNIKLFRSSGILEITTFSGTI